MVWRNIRGEWHCDWPRNRRSRSHKRKERLRRRHIQGRSLSAVVALPAGCQGLRTQDRHQPGLTQPWDVEDLQTWASRKFKKAPAKAPQLLRPKNTRRAPFPHSASTASSCLCGSTWTKSDVGSMFAPIAKIYESLLTSHSPCDGRALDPNPLHHGRHRASSGTAQNPHCADRALKLHAKRAF